MIALLVALATLVPAERPIIDAELSGQCEISEVAVYASGFAHFQVTNSCGTAPEEFTSGLRKVSASELKSLKESIDKARFSSLPESIEPDPKTVSTEEDVFSIRVWSKGVAKRVHAFGLDRTEDRGSAERFQALWAAVQLFGPREGK